MEMLSARGNLSGFLLFLSLTAMVRGLLHIPCERPRHLHVDYCSEFVHCREGGNLSYAVAR